MRQESPKTYKMRLFFVSGCGVVHSRMQGRVVCLEQIFLLLIGEMGFDVEHNRVLPCVDFDDVGQVFPLFSLHSRQRQ